MPSPAFELKDQMTRAGAGAGKTTGLVARVIEVFEHFRARGESPRIVLTTFTRKATQELKERLIARACEARDPELLQFCSDPSRLQISTIHGLLNTFLRQVGHLAGLDSGFQIVSESDGAQIARLALREVLVSTPDGLDWLETYGFARLLEMCRRFEAAWRETGALEPAGMDDLAAAATAETLFWRERLGRLAADIREDVPKWVAYAQGLDDFLAAWDGDCTKIALPKKPSRSKKEPQLDGWHDRIEDEINDGFKKEMGRPCWNQSLWPAMADAWGEFNDLATAYVERVESLKQGRARFEMSDLELKSLEILREKPFLGAVFAENWDYWMIDEYQDTSPVQVAILSALIGDRPKYFVGDPQQSIYLFRGAEVGVFDEAEARVTAVGGDVRELRQNWRSRPDLLHFMNAFVTDLGDQFAAMRARTEPGPPERTCARLVRAADSGGELEALVTRVGELVAGGARLEQICVLGRTHRNLSDAARALKGFGYPTHVHSSRGFNERREVVDARAVWKFLVNPHDNLNLTTLLRSPWFFTPDWRLVEIASRKPESLWRALIDLPENERPEAVTRLIAALARLEVEGLTRAFESTLFEASYLDLCLANDPAGRKEGNLWKLIARAREVEIEGGASALDFLKGSGGDPLDAAEGDAASAQEPNCINLMTIHGAKGLEFDHVILPGAGDGPRVVSTPVFGSAGELFFFPAWAEGENQFVPSPLDYVAARERSRRESREFDRWLYVALTRAKESLTVLWSKPDGTSWARRSSFCGRPTGVYDEDTFRFEVVESWDPPTAYAGAATGPKAIRAPFGVVTPPAEERRSVTEMVETPSKGIQINGLINRWRAQAAGTRIHRALEALKVGRTAGFGEFDEALNYVTSLTEPPMADLIRDGETEWGFQVQTGAGIIEGQIDLWSKRDGVLYVIDYKSGSDAFKEQAFQQLEIYAWALRRFGHSEAARLVVIYPLARQLEMRAFDSFARWEREFSGT